MVSTARAATGAAPPAPGPASEPTGDGGTVGVDLEVLEEIAQRVLWLSTRIVDAANRERETADGVKVGGHQASSASLVTAMTALWFAHLDAPDRVSVKPHASPVFHAIQYLLGNLDRSYLTRLRQAGGLQSYPSRTKDPDPVDFSTGSVGLGAAAPLFAAVARRYVDAHFGPRPASRFVALLGDAELDEGNVWEAIADPATQGLGNVMWIVDFNRQSLDRVVPGIRIQQWSQQFRRRAGTWWRSSTDPGSGRPTRSPTGTGSRRGSTRCPTSGTSRCSAWSRPPCGSASSTARPPRCTSSARRTTTRSSPPWSPTSAGTTSGRCSTPTGSATR